MALSHGMDTNHKTHVASQRETNETQCSKSWPVQTKETAYSGIVVTYPVQFTGTDLQQDRECGDWPDFLNSAYSYPKWRWADTFRSSVPTVVQDVGFLKQAMRLYGDSQCADDIRPWTLLDKGKDGLHPIPLKKTTPQGPIFFYQSHPPWSPWYPGSGHHPGPSWGPFHLGRRLSHDTFKTAFRGFLHVMEKYLV